MFCFFSATSTSIAAIYTSGEKFFRLLVFMIDSDVLFWFYGTLVSTIADITPDGLPTSYFWGELFLFILDSAYAIPPPGGGTLFSSLISTDDWAWT